MSLEIARAIGFCSSVCSVCFDSSVYNGLSSCYDPSYQRRCVARIVTAATSALTLRAASALPEGFFNLDEMLERMSEFSRDRFWLRRDDSMMA